MSDKELAQWDYAANVIQAYIKENKSLRYKTGEVLEYTTIWGPLLVVTSPFLLALVFQGLCSHDEGTVAMEKAKQKSSSYLSEPHNFKIALALMICGFAVPLLSNHCYEKFIALLKKDHDIFKNVFINLKQDWDKHREHMPALLHDYITCLGNKDAGMAKIPKQTHKYVIESFLRLAKTKKYI